MSLSTLVSSRRRPVLWVVVSAFCFVAHCGLLRAENRTFDGHGNNLENPTWGAFGSNFLRLAPHAYGARSNIADEGLPNPRTVSNQLFDQNELIPNPGNLSGYVYAFGQFISHDLQRTLSSAGETIDIFVPPGDPFFRSGPFPLTRSIFDESTGRSIDNPRQQVNFTSSFLDGSHIYGPSEIDSLVLRGGPFNPGAKLRTSDDINGDGQDFLPRDAFGPSFFADFIAGDDRANDNVVLTGIHIVFMREHNRLVDELSELNPHFDSDQLFQKARKIVGAQLQAITYNEFLPALLGNAAPDLRGSYDPAVQPDIINEFATIFLRIGHSMLTPDFKRVRRDGTQIESIPLEDAFFNPAFLDTNGELELLLTGLSIETQETVDLKLVDGMRFALLGAIDLQRARDHGLADYNTMREAYGLPRATSFADITADPEIQAQLESVYGEVDSVEAFVGALAEDHDPGANVGPLVSAVYVEQFTRLRDGDRFWYSNDDEFSPEEIADIESTTLSQIIARNTGIQTLQENVFFAASGIPFDCDQDGTLSREDLLCSNQEGSTLEVLDLLGLVPGDLNADGHVTFSDFLLLSDAYGESVDTYPEGDINGDGSVSLIDLLMLSDAYGAEQIAQVNAVPEPNGSWSSLVVLMSVMVLHRRLARMNVR